MDRKKVNPEKEPTALELQRRLELKEFFLEKGDLLNAHLVDHMFQVAANFDELKKNVLERNGEVPVNWRETDRYAKYKSMLAKGVGKKGVQEEMIKDGLDPEELCWDDEKTREMKQRMTNCATSAEKAKVFSEIEKKNSKNARLRRWTNKRVSSKRTLAKKPSVALKWSEFTAQQDIDHIKKNTSSGTLSSSFSSGRDNVSTNRSKKTGNGGMIQTLRRLRKKNKTKKRGKSEVVVAHRKRFESEERREEKDLMLQDSDEESAEENGNIKINKLHRSQFLYSAGDVEKENLGGHRKKSKTITKEQAEIARLARKNKIGHIHDYQPFFNKPADSVRKTSVGRIGKKILNVVSRSSTHTSKESVRRSRMKASIIFPDEADDEDLTMITDLDDSQEDVPPAPPPRPRRRTTTLQTRKVSQDV